jgi:hypothetical protein
MSFDWENFLTKNGVAFATSGKNVSHGNVAIHCPFCGPDDVGQHLSVSTQGRGWRCLRRPRDHRGKRPEKLVMAVLGCSYTAAARIVGNTTFLPDDFMAAVNKHAAGAELPGRARVLPMPEEFLPLGTNRPSAKIFHSYLTERGFDNHAKLTEIYGLKYAPRGGFKGRIIFPIIHDGKLISWTGRTVYPVESEHGIRYKTLTADPDKEPPIALGPVTDYLLWHDHLRNWGDTLVLVEGPFDALRVNVLGRARGIVATCLFTMQPSDRQIDLFHDLMPRFRRCVLLLDRGTTAATLRMLGELQTLDVNIREMPENTKDPGELKSTNDLVRILK